MRIQVLEWDVHFENDRSRVRDKCSFVCIPNKQHGVGLSLILQEADGGMIYGVWCLLLGFLSRQKRPRNGYLTVSGRGDGRYLTVSELALVWRRSKEEVERALWFVCQPNIMWAIDLDIDSPCTPHALPANSPCTPLEGKGREGNRREGNRTLRETSPPANPETGEEIILATTMPPTVEAMILYGARVMLPEVECRAAFDHYESNGWKVGKSRMVNWQAALRNWNKNHREGTYAKKNGQASPAAPRKNCLTGELL